ncbi:hypothetical protein AMAG_20626 [Allomyces macrogynus ATCC 38327]|uniref:RRM domain-containing protein n=1 Tax=Allomyces macrogynus (strain ATCC 38327) TaxID=578462 RepID=A0A0L0TDD0_ALLM3|nr:hypothetical protein AMAG_20626 [Allomyces macrogynus ATCC 38327]|eukprot:KNE72737.1 hypothetical protein AMAG_20626 [Allomyces macrogynus ATCC 38327]
MPHPSHHKPAGGTQTSWRSGGAAPTGPTRRRGSASGPASTSGATSTASTASSKPHAAGNNAAKPAGRAVYFDSWEPSPVTEASSDDGASSTVQSVKSATTKVKVTATTIKNGAATAKTGALAPTMRVPARTEVAPAQQYGRYASLFMPGGEEEVIEATSGKPPAGEPLGNDHAAKLSMMAPAAAEADAISSRSSSHDMPLSPGLAHSLSTQSNADSASPTFERKLTMARDDVGIACSPGALWDDMHADYHSLSNTEHTTTTGRDGYPIEYPTTLASAGNGEYGGGNAGFSDNLMSPTLRSPRTPLITPGGPFTSGIMFPRGRRTQSAGASTTAGWHDIASAPGTPMIDAREARFAQMLGLAAAGGAGSSSTMEDLYEMRSPDMASMHSTSASARHSPYLAPYSSSYTAAPLIPYPTTKSGTTTPLRSPTMDHLLSPSLGGRDMHAAALPPTSYSMSLPASPNMSTLLGGGGAGGHASMFGPGSARMFRRRGPSYNSMVLAAADEFNGGGMMSGAASPHGNAADLGYIGSPRSLTLGSPSRGGSCGPIGSRSPRGANALFLDEHAGSPKGGLGHATPTMMAAPPLSLVAEETNEDLEDAHGYSHGFRGNDKQQQQRFHEAMAMHGQFYPMYDSDEAAAAAAMMYQAYYPHPMYAASAFGMGMPPHAQHAEMNAAMAHLSLNPNANHHGGMGPISPRSATMELGPDTTARRGTPRSGPIKHILRSDSGFLNEDMGKAGNSEGLAPVPEAAEEETDSALAKMASVAKGSSGNDASSTTTKPTEITKTTSGFSVDMKGAVKHIYISDLPMGADEILVRKVFKRFGTIDDIRLSRSKTSGANHGVAYVKFTFPESVTKALEAADTMTMTGKRISVAATDPTEHPTKKLFFANVWDMTEQDLAPICAQFGEVVQVDVVADRGMMYVHFARLDDSVKAHRALQGLTINSRYVRVEFGQSTANYENFPYGHHRPYLKRPPYHGRHQGPAGSAGMGMGPNNASPYGPTGTKPLGSPTMDRIPGQAPLMRSGPHSRVGSAQSGWYESVMGSTETPPSYSRNNSNHSSTNDGSNGSDETYNNNGTMRGHVTPNMASRGPSTATTPSRSAVPPGMAMPPPPLGMHPMGPPYPGMMYGPAGPGGFSMVPPPHIAMMQYQAALANAAAMGMPAPPRPPLGLMAGPPSPGSTMMPPPPMPPMVGVSAAGGAAGARGPTPPGTAGPTPAQAFYKMRGSHTFVFF